MPLLEEYKMWIRKDLKQKARWALIGEYGKAILSSLMAVILIYIPMFAVNFVCIITVIMYRIIGSQDLDWGRFGCFIIALFIAQIIIRLFVNHLKVGLARYYLNTREKTGNIRDLFYAFGRGRYGNVFVVMFIQNLSIGLWSLLFVVPGIIKTYQYYLVPYILAENPDMNYREALKKSSDMMDGNKLNTLILELSFIGWAILGRITWGIASLFIKPYIEATYAELYCAIKSEKILSDARRRTEFSNKHSNYNY